MQKNLSTNLLSVEQYDEVGVKKFTLSYSKDNLNPSGRMKALRELFQIETGYPSEPNRFAWSDKPTFKKTSSGIQVEAYSYDFTLTDPNLIRRAQKLIPQFIQLLSQKQQAVNIGLDRPLAPQGQGSHIQLSGGGG